jgi:2-methylcitrate dehydratase PrpD
MPFGAAVAIVKGRASLSEYTQENLDNREIKKIMKKVRCLRDAELETDFPRKWPARVIVKTKNGAKYESWVDIPKGDPENPLSWDELIDKFNELTSDYMPNDKRNNFVSQVKSISDMNKLQDLL